MSTVSSQGDPAADDGNLPGDPSGWDEEWLPEWVNLEDENEASAGTPAEDDSAPEPPDPEVDRQLAADLQAVERLVASLLTESSAAFEASVGGWDPDDAPEPPASAEPSASAEPAAPAEPPARVERPAQVAPASNLASVGFSLGIARPVPQRTPLPEAPLPQAPPPSAPVVVSPPAPPRRRLGWLVAPLVLLLAGAVVGTFLWAGAARRPTPAAAVQTDADLGTSSALPTWSRPSGSLPTAPVPVTTAPSSPSTSAPSTAVSHVRRVRRAASGTAARTSTRPALTSQVVPAPIATTPSPSATVGSESPPTCSSAATTTDSTPTQTTGPTPTATETTAPTETTTQAPTTTSTQTTASQPSLASAASCSN